MDRRNFLRQSLLWGAAGAGASLLRFGPVLGATTASVEDNFARASTSKGWGKQWFNQRSGLPWGISKKKAFFDLPEPQPGAGRHNPNPVVLLNDEALDVDIRAKLSATNPGARFGLMGRMVGYSDFYAVYLDGSRVFLSRFGVARERELKGAAFAVKPDTTYWVRFKVSGTRPSVKLQAKVWPASGKEPKAWTVTGSDTAKPIDKPGSLGFVFLHDFDGQKKARVRVSDFSATTTLTQTKPKPTITFAYAGRTEQSGSLQRAYVVAKADTPSDLSFHVGLDPKLTTFDVVPAAAEVAKLALAKGVLEDLVPGTTVYWRAEATSKTGKKRRSPIRKLMVPALGQQTSFAFGSCSHSFSSSRSFATAAELGPAFFSHLGDFGYAQNDEGAARAHTTDAYQDRWVRMLARPSMRKLHANSALVLAQDDHDYGNDNCWRDTVRTFSVGAFDAVAANDGKRYFDGRYGDVHCFWVDSHLYSDDPFAPDGPNHSMLGAAQKSWLKSAMAASDASLLVLFSPMPFWSGGQGLTSYKTAFRTERAELLDFMFGLQGSNRRVIICSGNSHAQIVNRHPHPSGGKDVYEFVSSGTDRFENTVGVPLGVDDGIVDPQRSRKGVDAFGHVSLDAAGPNRRVRLRCVNSKTGANVWPPLELDL